VTLPPKDVAAQEVHQPWWRSLLYRRPTWGKSLTNSRESEDGRQVTMRFNVMCKNWVT